MDYFTDALYCKGHVETAQNMNILDIPYPIFSKICDEVHIVPGLVNRIIATQDNTEYKLSLIEVSECHKSPLSTPCERLLQLWGTKGMTVIELVNILDKLRLERPLQLLINPIPLRLVKDIPLNVELEEGDTLKLECYATGFPYPKYCWFRDRTLICQNVTGQLEITNVGLNDTGSYVCRIHNELKKLDEIKWTSKCEVFVKEGLHRQVDRMTIHDQHIHENGHLPISIHFKKQLPKHLNIMNGEPLQLTVEAVGTQPLHYVWCRNQEIISDATDGPVLSIPCMSHEKRGIYQCTVYNKDTECKSNECQVKVIYPSPNTTCTDEPVITLQPTDKQESINGIAVFLVKAQCIHDLHYQWYHNGTVLKGSFNNELRFFVKRRDQEGDYQCRISTDSGHAVMSRVAKLKIVRCENEAAYYATDKLAILLGQSNYRSNNKQLPAVRNDLYEAHELFSSLGFKTISSLDNTLDEMNKMIHLAVDMMRGSANDKLYVVLYVVGHGFIHHGVSYLMPSSATEGTQVCNCLSLELVENCIIQELNPVAFLMILDICQTEINHILQEKPPPSSHGPVSKGMVIFRAATKGQEALETQCQQESCNVKAEASSSPDNITSLGGWVDISRQRQSRGIFSQALFRILRKSETLILQDLYKAMNDEFQRPDPTLSATKGKEQDPVFEINLKEERSLYDRINPEGQEVEYEKRLSRYNQLTSKSLPADFHIYIPLQSPDKYWKIIGTFAIKASNVLELILYEEDKRPSDQRQLQMTFDINAQSVPLQTRPCHYYRYKDDPDSAIKQKRGFLFYNLQQLQSRLSFVLDIVYSSSSEKSESVLVQAGYPLISRIWNMAVVSKEDMRECDNREACENSDSGESEV